jgi:putative DNA primase/helicase
MRDAPRRSEREPEIPALDELLDAVVALVRHYVALTDAQLVAVALWVAHVHAIAATSTTAYLHVTSAELESGKTRLLELLEQLVPKPLWLGASISTASVYRAVHELCPTLLVDEADNALKDRAAKAELLGVLNMGYQRGKTVLRIGGPRNDRLDFFEVFCPKAIAGLDDLPPTLASRCLRIEMRRRLPHEDVADFFRDEAEEYARPIRESLTAWADQNVEQLRQARPVRLGVRDRLEETLRLLLAIADAAGHTWSPKGRSALIDIALGPIDESESSRVTLLRDLRGIFEAVGSEEMNTAEVLAALFECDECPYAEWWGDVRRDAAGRVLPNRGAAMKLAQMLRPFAIHSRDVGPTDNRRKGYRLSDFEDAFARYLRTEVAQVVQTSQAGDEPRSSSRAAEEPMRNLDEPSPRSTGLNARPARLQPGSNEETRLGCSVRCEKHEKTTRVSKIAAGLVFYACGCVEAG